MLPLLLPSLSLSYTRESLERFFYLCAGNGRVALHGSESLTRCRRFSPLDSSSALLAPTCLDSNDALPITSLTLAFSVNKATGDVCHLLCPQGKSTLWIYWVDRVARYRAIELINSLRGSGAWSTIMGMGLRIVAFFDNCTAIPLFLLLYQGYMFPFYIYVNIIKSFLVWYLVKNYVEIYENPWLAFSELSIQFLLERRSSFQSILILNNRWFQRIVRRFFMTSPLVYLERNFIHVYVYDIVSVWHKFSKYTSPSTGFKLVYGK